MTLADIIDDVDSSRHTLTVLNRESSDPMLNLLTKTFDSEHVDVREAGTEPSAPANILQLQDEDGLALATSPFEAVRNHLLMVNSDMYITGTRSLEEVETSQVVANLDDTTFTVSDKRKFLLIHISRHVEALARETGSGVLHAGFQELSRIHDERGTEQAYRELATTDLDVHVYGAPDADADAAVDAADWNVPLEQLSVHAGHDEDLRKGWFVVHDGDGADARKAALVCTEVGENEYEGFWTYQASVVDDVLAYLERRYVE